MVRVRCLVLPFAATTLAALTLPSDLFAQAGEQVQFSPPSGSSTQRFGLALAIDGDEMAIGGPYNDTAAGDAGSVWVWRWDATLGAWQMEQQIFASDAESLAHFGASVAIRGDLLVVGSPQKNTTLGSDGGQVYVFRYDATNHVWNEEQRLVQSSGAPSDAFGTSVAVSGDVLLGGAPMSDTTAGGNSGSAFVFRYQNSTVKWLEETQLIDPDGASNDHAGTCVVWDGTSAAVASPDSTENVKGDAGSIGIWNVSGTTWTQVQELTATTPQTSAHFGVRVRLYGDRLSATAPDEDESAGVTNSGAVHLFRLVSGTFAFEQRLTEPVPVAGARFGSDVATSDCLVVVGAMQDDVSGKVDCGASHLFRTAKKGGGWIYDHQLCASDRVASDRLGAQVALHDDLVMATADGKNTAAGADFGAVYGYAPAEMTLTIDPEQPAAGQLITFSAFRGDPGALCLVTVEDVGGSPNFIPLLTIGFAADHALTFTANAPNPLLGISLGLRAYKQSPRGGLTGSALAYVDV
jgi:hypothetical protein